MTNDSRHEAGHALQTSATSAKPGDGGRRVALTVVFGGISGEHPISCATAAGVLHALDQERYDITTIAVTTDGQWVEGPSDPAELEGGTVRITSGRPVVLARRADGGVEVRSSEPGEPARVLAPVDVVLPLLHGAFGEDGTVQGMFEMLGVRYVGSGVASSAMSMDKHLMKVALAGSGMAVEPYTVLTARTWRTDRAGVLAEAAELRTPLFVKPCRAGSSLGISRVADMADLPAAIKEALCHDPKVIIEQGVPGREIECGVLGGHGDDAPRSAAPGEVVLDLPEGGFYDYETKYFSREGAVRMQVPADIPDDVAQEVRREAVRAFEALDCEGLARVDFFLTDDCRVVVNEVNTMPGFTPYSMFPVMWRSAGMTYAELLDELISLALERPLGLR